MTELADPVSCGQCGRPHVRADGKRGCSGHRKDGAPCGQMPMVGQRVCARRHGGKAPQNLAAAERRVAEEKARAVVGRLFDVDAPPVKDATAAALRLAGQLSAMVDRLGASLDSGDSLSQPDRLFFTAMVGQLRPLLIDIERLGLGRAEVALRREEFKLAAVALGRTFQFLELGLERQAAGLEFFRREVRAVIEEGEGP